MPQTGYKNIYYRYKRFFVFSVITLFALIIPYITINGNHFFLLSFERKQLHLLFASFATQELFLMPFVLIFFFISIKSRPNFGRLRCYSRVMLSSFTCWKIEIANPRKLPIIGVPRMKK
mgnify:CR=1 FL=1